MCLFHSAEITDVLKNFSGFTGFINTPNGQNFTRIYHFFTFIYIPGIMITLY